MDDDDKTKEQAELAELEDNKFREALQAMGESGGVRFAIHSVVRSRHNRTRRASVAANNRHRFKQFVLPQQARLVRGRPVIITEQQLMEHVDELYTKEKAGILEVRTAHAHRRVDLEKIVAWRDDRRELETTADPEIGHLPPAAVEPPPVEPPVPNPVTPVDEMQHVGKDWVPPFEGAEKDQGGPEIPMEGAAEGAPFDEPGDGTTELMGIPPAMPTPGAPPSTSTEDEEEYTEKPAKTTSGSKPKAPKKKEGR